MLKLIRLEWKKNNIKKYIWKTGILMVCINLFIYALTFLGIANDTDGTLDAASGYEGISAPIELFTGIAFLILASAMMASFIVGAYKNKTMNLMFAYPIRRQKLLAASMLSVWIFCLAALMAVKLAVYGCVFLGAERMMPYFFIDFDMGSPSFYLQLFAGSLLTISLSFIALFVGMALKSSKAVLITGFLLVFLTQANIGDLTLAGNAAFSAALLGISLLAAGAAVWNIEKKDCL